MNTEEYPREVEIAQIAAIISNSICDELFELLQTGYIGVTEQIAIWAVEFYEKHKDTNWEEYLEAHAQPLSKAFAKTCMFCWDDIIIDFANFKLEEIKK